MTKLGLGGLGYKIWFSYQKKFSYPEFSHASISTKLAISLIFFYLKI